MDTLIKPKKGSVVRILGLGPSVVELPVAKEGEETWGIQYTWENYKLTRAFTLDDREWIITKNESFDVPKDVREDMRRAKIPIYVAHKWPDVENTVEYPIEEIKKEFPVHFFMDSFAYMLALAIYEKFDRIELYGIDLRYFNEEGIFIGGENIEKFVEHRNWLDETHCSAFWAGVAVGRGIEVITTKRSSLMKPVYPNDPSMYGYESSPLIQSQRSGILNKRNKQRIGQEKERVAIFRKPEGMSQEDFMKNLQAGSLKPIGYANSKTVETTE